MLISLSGKHKVSHSLRRMLELWVAVELVRSLHVITAFLCCLSFVSIACPGWWRRASLNGGHNLHNTLSGISMKGVESYNIMIFVKQITAPILNTCRCVHACWALYDKPPPGKCPTRKPWAWRGACVTDAPAFKQTQHSQQCKSVGERLCKPKPIQAACINLVSCSILLSLGFFPPFSHDTTSPSVIIPARQFLLIALDSTCIVFRPGKMYLTRWPESESDQIFWYVPG